MALRTVHSYNLQSKVAHIYSDMLSEINSRAASAAFKAGVLFGLSEGIMLWFYAIAFWFGGGEIEKGRMNLEQMLKVFFAILVSSMGIGQAQMSFPDLAKGKSAVQRMFRGTASCASACHCALLSPPRSDAGRPRRIAWHAFAHCARLHARAVSWISLVATAHLFVRA